MTADVEPIVGRYINVTIEGRLMATYSWLVIPAVVDILWRDARGSGSPSPTVARVGSGSIAVVVDADATTVVVVREVIRCRGSVIAR